MEYHRELYKKEIEDKIEKKLLVRYSKLLGKDDKDD